MKIIKVTAVSLALLGGLLACTQTTETASEESSSSAQALGEDACKFVEVDPNGVDPSGMGTPTNFGKIVSGLKFGGCPAAFASYATPSNSYPGDPSCPNQAVMRIYAPTGSSANFSVEPSQFPTDQATCEAMHITATVWAKSPSGSWTQLNVPGGKFPHYPNNQTIKSDYTGIWAKYASGPYHCAIGWDGGGMVEPPLDVDLSQYTEIRLVGSAYRVQ